MPNLLNYLKAAKDLSFGDLPLNDLDRICINELAYIPFGELAGWTTSDSQTLFDFLEENVERLHVGELITENRLRLSYLMAISKRFEKLTISHYVSSITVEFERQFAAALFTLPDSDYHQIVFRGTDDTLIGWKEDFKLTYMREIPSHRSAIRYLKHLLPHLEGEIVISGHSKGGNLALYASTQLPKNLQDKVSRIIWLDSPGVQEYMLTIEGYLNIKDRVQGYLPQDSIVGIMLWHLESKERVVSDAFSIGQHNIFSWQVDLKHLGTFQEATHQGEVSRSLEKTFKEWTDELGIHELKQIFDLVFDSFLDNGLSRFSDFTFDEKWKILAALAQFGSLDKAKRHLLTHSAKLLLAQFTTNFVAENFKKHPAPQEHRDK